MCMSDIICVTNRRLCRESFLTRVARIAACRPAGILLREKDLSPAEYTALAEQVAAICDRYGVTCILHSFVDAALTLRAEAIHLPLPTLLETPQEKKSMFRHLGASCHSVEDALLAQALGCTYITAGHVFDTDCKKGLPGRGVPFLRDVCGSVAIPVCAIGGIDGNNIAAVRSAGAKGACLMSSLMITNDIPGLLRTMEERK